MIAACIIAAALCAALGSVLTKGYRNATIWWLKNELTLTRGEYEKERVLRLKAEGQRDNAIDHLAALRRTRGDLTA